MDPTAINPALFSNLMMGSGLNGNSNVVGQVSNISQFQESGGGIDGMCVFFGCLDMPMLDRFG